MKNRKPSSRIGRNETCPCGSRIKFKRCHGRHENDQRIPVKKQYVDMGESPIRWVISNETGTAFFSDIKNRVLVFADKQVAHDVIRLDLFSGAEDNEINLAGVGPTKWQHLQETVPFIEVESFELAKALLQERISGKMTELETNPDNTTVF